MNNITPTTVEYVLEIREHVMRATVEHLELARRFTFSFDDKVVAEKAVGPGEFFTDDDCISEMVQNYCKNNSGVFADLFGKHADQVRLIEKKLDFLIEQYGIKLYAHVCESKGKYNIEVKSSNDEDTFTGVFTASSFSEVLEKVRIFTSTLIGISDSFSSNIDELSNDKVEAWIKWE